MAKKTSAGILLYRRREALEVLLIHPGAPFWAKKDLGAWSVPKGELQEGEDPLPAAIREFTEETGFPLAGDFHPLQPCRQASGKVVYAWAVEGDCDPAALRSTSSPWNGLPSPATSRTSPKPIAPPGSPSPKPADGSLRARPRSSTSGPACLGCNKM